MEILCFSILCIRKPYIFKIDDLLELHKKDTKILELLKRLSVYTSIENDLLQQNDYIFNKIVKIIKKM